MMMGHRLCVPDVGELKKEIMEETHSFAYAMHPGSTKMYHTLREHYWWRGMKKVLQSLSPDVSFVSKSKLSIKDLQGSYSLFRSLSGNGRKSRWILW